jgi:hypothetical protein
MRMLATPATVLGLVVLAGTARGDSVRSADGLRLVPYPQAVEQTGGAFALNRPTVLQAGSDCPASAIECLQAELRRFRYLPPRATVTGTPLTLLWVAENSPPPAAISPAWRADAGDEDYLLAVRPQGVCLQARTPLGLMRGASTLCQLVRANRDGDAIPAVTIRDWPVMPWRAFQDDLTRGPSSTLQELKREVALGAAFKQNLFTYYMENQFAFRRHPLIGPADGSLLPEELRELVDWGRARGVEVLGNQQSFGHFGNILKHPQYAPLRETDWILTPVRDETYRLLDDLYGEVIPLLPFPFFNVCCDETQGLGTGPARELAAKIGEGGVYVQHIRRVYDLVRGKYGKRMMMWGDIILNHPGHLREIPRDVILLTWGYDPRDNFEGQIRPFADAGYDFFVCPGVNNWGRMLPDFQGAAINIRNFIRDGARHHAMGVINTAWDDDGETLNAPNWYGFAWGAECSWNASRTTLEQFNRRIGSVLFGERGDHFARAIEQLNRIVRLPGMRNGASGRFWELELSKPVATVSSAQAQAEQLVEMATAAIQELEACRSEAVVNAELLESLAFGASRMELIGRRTLDAIEAALAYQKALEDPAQAEMFLGRAEQVLRADVDRHKALAGRFRELWDRENRPYARNIPLARYQSVTAQYEQVLARLTQARSSLREGRPLPDPAEVGLELYEMAARRVRPQRLEYRPLDPSAEWHERSAPGRFGLEIQTGRHDGEDLPVEVLLPVGPDLAGLPARAFVAWPGTPVREVPAQLEFDEQEGAGRLVLVISGLVPKDTTIRAWVYPACATSSELPGAARARADGSNWWLENDKARLLLGTGGGHLYRWHVRDLDDRDVTMPGDTDWAGFSDINGEARQATWQLLRIAAGPAVVRFRCVPETGAAKTISLYAGACWADITLDSPVTYYWDFDDPANFAADGTSPGRYAFSTGQTGAVGRQADGLKAQVAQKDASWAAKYVENRWMMAMLSPDVPTRLVIAPGAGAGGIGIEGGPAACHFVTWAGRLQGRPADHLERLRWTLAYRNIPRITVFSPERATGTRPQ